MTKHIYRWYAYITINKSISKNQEAVREQLKQLYREAKNNRDTKDFDFEVLKASLNVLALLKAMIALIVVRNQPYYMVEQIEF